MSGGVAASTIAPRIRSIDGLEGGRPASRVRRSGGAVTVAIVAAWSVVLITEATGTAQALHHHALIEGGLPPWVVVPLFLLSWQVMVAAMMLPASLPTIRAVETAAGRLPRPRRTRAAFLGAFALVWAAFGLLAFLGDFGLHRIVDATPWLAERPWLIEAGALGLAGTYQLGSVKRRNLVACRHAGERLSGVALQAVGAGRSGALHGMACLGSTWALMLLMFAEGFANVGWMVALAGVMTYEATGRHGHRVAVLAGIVLILAALAVLSGPGPSR